ILIAVRGGTSLPGGSVCPEARIAQERFERLYDRLGLEVVDKPARGEGRPQRRGEVLRVDAVAQVQLVTGAAARRMTSSGVPIAVPSAAPPHFPRRNGYKLDCCGPFPPCPR